MKNLKNTLAAVGLAAVLGIGAVTANAGIIKSDSSTKGATAQCTVKNESVIGKFAGFVTAGLSGMGFRTSLFDSLIYSDAPCKTNDVISMDGYRKC